MSGNLKINITPKVYLPTGTMVKITKVLAFKPSDVKVGSTSYGNLKEDLKVDKAIALNNTSFNTTTVLGVIESRGEDFIVNTQTSVYFVQKI